MILLYLSVNYFCHAEFDGEFCPFYVYFVKDFDGSRSGQFLTVAAPGLDLNTQDILIGSFGQYTGLHLHVRNYPDFAGI